MHFTLDFFMEIFFLYMEDNVPEQQPNLGPYCLQYKLHNKINSKLHQQTKEKQKNGSLEKVKLCKLHNSYLNFNCAYVGGLKQMCKL